MRPTRYRGKPCQDQGRTGHGIPYQHQRSTTADRKNRHAQSIHFKIHRKEHIPFFKTLRTVKNFEWMIECHQAFEELKAYLAKLPLLVKPSPGDILYLYISSTSQAISSVLVREDEGQTRTIGTISEVGNRVEYGISYLPRTTIKAQALADFVSEMTRIAQEKSLEKEPWILHVDGSSTMQGSGAGKVITSPQGEDMELYDKIRLQGLK
ncbi:UNVERIFIED_CONTAM: hypothetical protein Slati_0503200 [Sesamum latifolium]|uniref:Reverse transcriptase/retrotransposon-derived protein RNase H-like domain-containing protein n=1 Tax=Sesamum latifolium TaxID=2727402 RepID=A0AAW2Y0Q1_9LAMI